MNNWLTWSLLSAVFAGATVPLPVSRRAWFFLALSGLATGLSWLCYFRAWRMRSSWPFKST